MKKDYDTQKDTLSHRETRTHAHTHAHTYTEKCVMHIDPHVHGCILYIEIIYIYIYLYCFVHIHPYRNRAVYKRFANIAQTGSQPPKSIYRYLYIMTQIYIYT